METHLRFWVTLGVLGGLVFSIAFTMLIPPDIPGNRDSRQGIRRSV